MLINQINNQVLTPQIQPDSKNIAKDMDFASILAQKTQGISQENATEAEEIKTFDPLLSLSEEEFLLSYGVSKEVYQNATIKPQSFEELGLSQEIRDTLGEIAIKNNGVPYGLQTIVSFALEMQEAGNGNVANEMIKKAGEKGFEGLLELDFSLMVNATMQRRQEEKMAALFSGADYLLQTYPNRQDKRGFFINDDKSSILQNLKDFFQNRISNNNAKDTSFSADMLSIINKA